MKIRFVIPGEPRGQGRARATSIGGHARMYKAKEDRLYEQRVASVGKDAMGREAPISCPCIMTIDAHLSIPKSASKKKRAAMLAGAVVPIKKPDISNIAKAVEDGLNGIVYDDDRQIVQTAIRKIYSENPCVIVTIREWAPPLEAGDA